MHPTLCVRPFLVGKKERRRKKCCRVSRFARRAWWLSCSLPSSPPWDWVMATPLPHAALPTFARSGAASRIAKKKSTLPQSSVCRTGREPHRWLLSGTASTILWPPTRPRPSLSTLWFVNLSFLPRPRLVNHPSPLASRIIHHRLI